jgi:hypothetical protein
VDWTVTPNLFNSFRYGIQSSVSGNNMGNAVTQWSSQNDRRVTFGSGVAPFIPNATPLIRSNPAYTISDEVNWVKGKHTFKLKAARSCIRVSTKTISTSSPGS